jgi:hypothetical protein
VVGVGGWLGVGGWATVKVILLPSHSPSLTPTHPPPTPTHPPTLKIVCLMVEFLIFEEYATVFVFEKKRKEVETRQQSMKFHVIDNKLSHIEIV